MLSSSAPIIAAITGFVSRKTLRETIRLVVVDPWPSPALPFCPEN
jgi:hypothetical protein